MYKASGWGPKCALMNIYINAPYTKHKALLAELDEEKHNSRRVDEARGLARLGRTSTIYCILINSTP